MKGLLFKEHYYYSIHTSLMKSSDYPHSIDNSPYPLTLTPHLLQKNHKPLAFYDFSEISPNSLWR